MSGTISAMFFIHNVTNESLWFWTTTWTESEKV